MQSSSREIVTLRSALASRHPANPALLSAHIIPWRAMMLYQVRAYLPGLGEFDLLAAPPLSDGLAKLNGGAEDFNGNASFSMGGAFLAPFVNRIRGRYAPALRAIGTPIHGKCVVLVANGGGKAKGAEQYAIHGLILNRPADVLEIREEGARSLVRAIMHAGDFGGHWLSAADFEFEFILEDAALIALMRVKNVGSETLPIGLGWHPYFNVPSGQREQARLRLPAKNRLLVNNYDEVLPTGEIAPVSGSVYDFRAPQGAPLGNLYLDDCFVGIKKTARGKTVCELTDPAAGYRLRIVSDSTEISAIQTFAPPDKAFIAIEPQFSWADPYGKQWGDINTGMVALQPGETADYRVSLEILSLHQADVGPV
jgi:aldose 1-epimerase